MICKETSNDRWLHKICYYIIKKTWVVVCNEHRTISFIHQAAKVLMRLESNTNFRDRNQIGFKKNVKQVIQ